MQSFEQCHAVQALVACGYTIDDRKPQARSFVPGLEGDPDISGLWAGGAPGWEFIQDE